MSPGCCCCGTPLSVVGAVTCRLPRRVLWVWSHGTHGTDTGPSTQTHTRPVLTNLDHGDTRGSPSPRRGRDKPENRELFREGVEGQGTKIRPLVPKKTLAPSKALERGSSARNVTPGGASAGLGNEVSLRDPCDRQAGGPGHLSSRCPPAGCWMELILTASCLGQVSRKGWGSPYEADLLG